MLAVESKSVNRWGQKIKSKTQELKEKLEAKLKSEGFSDSDILYYSDPMAQASSTEACIFVSKEMQSFYNVSANRAAFLLHSSKKIDDIDNLAEYLNKYNVEDKKFVLIDQYYFYVQNKMPLEEFVKEVSLVHDVKPFLVSSNCKFFVSEIMKKWVQLKLSEILNTISKHETISDKALFDLACFRDEDIASGKITLEEALSNAEKYGYHSSYKHTIGTKPAHVKIIDAIKWLFGFGEKTENLPHKDESQELKVEMKEPAPEELVSHQCVHDSIAE